MLLYYWRTPIMDGLDPSKPKLLPSLADPYKKHLNCQPMVKFFLLWQSRNTLVFSWARSLKWSTTSMMLCWEQRGELACCTGWQQRRINSMILWPKYYAYVVCGLVLLWSMPVRCGMAPYLKSMPLRWKACVKHLFLTRRIVHTPIKKISDLFAQRIKLARPAICDGGISSPLPSSLPAAK